jgi:type II secretory pathway component PulF
MDAFNHDRSLQRQHWIYAAATLVVLALVLCFLWVFIIPTLRLINDEFALETHPLFQVFIDVVDWITQFAPLLIFGIAVIAFLLWARPSRQYFRRFFAGRWIHSVAQTRSSQLLRLLATSVEAGRPVPTAISTLARYHFDPNVRQKLLFARNEMEQGNDAWLSLVDAGLLTPQEATAIAQAPSNPSRAWAMRELADWSLHQTSSRQLGFTRWLQPLLTLLFAAVVLLVAGAMMGFLSQMVHSLAQP